MFTNRNAITIWERSINPETRMERYTIHAIKNIYWEEAKGETIDKSRTQKDTILCIIPVDSIAEYFPKPDDIIAVGIHLTDTPPEQHFTITQVKDFLYGSRRVQHLEVIAV